MGVWGVGGGGKTDQEFIFPTLPGAQDEAQYVAQIWKTQAILGKQATVERIYPQLNQHTIVHLAAHGVADVQRPLRHSFIALTQGRLSALQLLRQPHDRTQLMVLSACQSGLGFQHRQGTIGLARAVYLSGVPRVLVSLWNVDDAATKTLMGYFHQRLSADAPSQALRHAMLKTRRDHPKPAQWASFVLFGHPW